MFSKAFPKSKVFTSQLNNYYQIFKLHLSSFCYKVDSKVQDKMLWKVVIIEMYTFIRKIQNFYQIRLINHFACYILSSIYIKVFFLFTLLNVYVFSHIHESSMWNDLSNLLYVTAIICYLYRNNKNLNNCIFYSHLHTEPYTPLKQKELNPN